MLHCPTCRSEFRDGFTTCADCGGPLASGTAPPPEPVEAGPGDAPATLLSTTSMERALATSALVEDHGIPCRIDNLHGPSSAIGLPGPASMYLLLVPSGRLADARALLDEAAREVASAAPDPAFAESLEKHRNRSRWRWVAAGTLLMLGLPGTATILDGPTGIFAWYAWAVVLAGFVLYVRSRGPRLPETAVVAMAAAGALSTLLLVPLVWTPLQKFQEDHRGFHIIVLGPALEELLKIAGVVLCFVIRPAWRVHPYAWVTAGAAAGAGFGFVENFVYLGGEMRSVDPLVGFLSRSGALLHVVTTSLFAGQLRGRGPGLPVDAFMGFVFAWSLHAIWNALAHFDAAWLVLPYGAIILPLYLRSLPKLAADPAPATT